MKNFDKIFNQMTLVEMPTILKFVDFFNTSQKTAWIYTKQDFLSRQNRTEPFFNIIKKQLEMIAMEHPQLFMEIYENFMEFHKHKWNIQ